MCSLTPTYQPQQESGPVVGWRDYLAGSADD